MFDFSRIKEERRFVTTKSEQEASSLIRKVLYESKFGNAVG